MLRCLHGEHLASQLFPLTGIFPRGIVKPSALIVLDHGVGPAQITLYGARRQAARTFSRHGKSDPEMLDGNAIINFAGFPLPPQGASMPALRRCVFGAGASIKESPAYLAAYAHPLTGRAVVAQSGCLACHTIGAQGNNGPGPVLTHIGSRLSTRAITHALVAPKAPMPSFIGLRTSNPAAFRALVSYLSGLR